MIKLFKWVRQHTAQSIAIFTSAAVLMTAFLLFISSEPPKLPAQRSVADQQIERLMREMRRLELDVRYRPYSQGLYAATDPSNEKEVEARIAAIESVVMADPAKAVQLPLLEGHRRHGSSNSRSNRRPYPRTRPSIRPSEVRLWNDFFGLRRYAR